MISNHTVGDYCFRLKTADYVDLLDVNATWVASSHGLIGRLKSPRGTLIRIEVLVAVISLSTVFLAICGSLRRRCRNFWAQKLVQAVYIMSASLVIYTLGSMQSVLIKSNLYPIWAASLFILLGSADSITAYSLDDNNQQMKQIYQSALCFVYVVLIAITIITAKNVVGLFIYLAFVTLKFVQRQLACRMASGSWNLSKMVADRMYVEHTWNGGSYNPVRMTGYHYLVDWSGRYTDNEANNDDEIFDIIDIEKIWQCKELSEDLKDDCLSFSLFHLLRRRFFGFACAESSQPKTHDFVFKGLLAENEDGTINYNRVFKLIEVELGFMYDFFFTKHAAIYYGTALSAYASFFASFFLMLFLSIMAKFAVPVPDPRRFNYFRNLSSVTTTTTADVVITVVIIAGIALLELLQMLLYWTSIWGRVSLSCLNFRVERERINTNTRRKKCWMRFKKCFIKIFVSMSNKRTRSYWQKKLGQYSLLKSVPYNPDASKISFLSTLRLTSKCAWAVNIYVFENRLVDDSRRAVDKQGEPVLVPAQLNKAVVQALLRLADTGTSTRVILTNGESSLKTNNADDLMWACMNPDSDTNCLQKKENQSDIILTWHIATSYCEMAAPVPVGGEQVQTNFMVATKLSKYCAYLVAYQPKLLPGHHYVTSCRFSAVAEEAVHSLQRDQDKCVAMRRLAESTIRKDPAERNTLEKGAALGRQLEVMEEFSRWKVLADFWAEMLLYVAPSDNVREHIECLARGGEYVTHLWALLSHAGILKREVLLDPHLTQVENV